MVADTSAVLAILFDEPEAPVFEEILAQDAVRLMSVASALEAHIVVSSRFGPAGLQELELLFTAVDMQLVPVTLGQLTAARQAFSRFGKGRHQAGLNFGDCFAYALARTTGEPLLFKGKDFRLTDVHPRW